MAQPFDYNIASPNAAFQNAFAFGTAIADRQAAQVKAAEEKARAQKAQEALQSVITDRTPENIAKVLLLYPALKDQITASESVLNEAEIKSANQFRGEVITLFKSNPASARARLVEQANAYANTVGKEKEAAAAQALLKSFDINPDAVIVPMTMQLAQSDDKLYKTLFENVNLTAFQKNLVAANIDPDSPRGRALAESFVANEADPIVEMETPNNGRFVGPRSEYFRRYGEKSPAPTTIPSPASKAEYDALPPGTQYRAPDGSLKMKGGQTGIPAPSGNFR